MKYSIIVPIYNIEKYLRSCLDSLKKQKYDNLEIICVDDGSTDNSASIVKEYVKTDKRFKYYKKTNGGVSDARNYGISKASGKYLIFIDGDDFVSDDYILLIDKSIDEKYDVLCFYIANYNLNTKSITNKDKPTNFLGDGLKTFKHLAKEAYFVSPCRYVIKRSFWDKNKFSFTKGRYHEDFGLIPYMILQTKTVAIIDKAIYYYVDREESITTTKDLNKLKKRVDDILYLYDDLMNKTTKLDISNVDKEFIYSYLTNALLKGLKIIDGKLLDEYIDIIRKKNVFKYLLKNNLKRKIKFIVCKTNPKFYIKHFM